MALGLLCLGVACGGVGPHPPVRTVPPALAAAPPPTEADALAIVGQLYRLLGAGETGAAYALWSPDWQRAHPLEAWAAGPPIPPGAVPEPGTPRREPDGTVFLPVRATVDGPAGRRWADGGYRVGGTAGHPVLLGGGLRPPTPPVDLQAMATRSRDGGQTGEASCGGYRVAWTVTPGTTPGGGATSRVSIIAPDGQAVPAPPLPPFSFGTFPTACGDLFDDGGQELVLTTAETTAGAYREAAVYRLEGHRARLIGQIPSVGSVDYPRPGSPDGLYPLGMVGLREIAVVAGHPVLAPEYWLLSGLAFRVATARFPAALAADRDRRLARLRAGEGCSASPPVCEADDLLLVYYDGVLLGQSAQTLAELQALLPPGDRGWLRSQAAAVDYQLRLP